MYLISGLSALRSGFATTHEFYRNGPRPTSTTLSQTGTPRAITQRSNESHQQRAPLHALYAYKLTQATLTPRQYAATPVFSEVHRMKLKRSTSQSLSSRSKTHSTLPDRFRRYDVTGRCSRRTSRCSRPHAQRSPAPSQHWRSPRPMRHEPIQRWMG